MTVVKYPDNDVMFTERALRACSSLKHDQTLYHIHEPHVHVTKFSHGLLYKQNSLFTTVMEKFQ